MQLLHIHHERRESMKQAKPGDWVVGHRAVWSPGGRSRAAVYGRIIETSKSGRTVVFKSISGTRRFTYRRNQRWAPMGNAARGDLYMVPND